MENLDKKRTKADRKYANASFIVLQSESVSGSMGICSLKRIDLDNVAWKIKMTSLESIKADREKHVSISAQLIP